MPSLSSIYKLTAEAIAYDPNYTYADDDDDQDMADDGENEWSYDGEDD